MELTWGTWRRKCFFNTIGWECPCPPGEDETVDESVCADEEDEEEVGGVGVGLCTPAGEEEDEEDEWSRDRLIRATRAAIASWMTVLPWLVVL